MLTTVRIARVDLEQPPAIVADLDATLAPDERTGPMPARVVRAAARDLLARELGVDPAAVEISRVCARCGHPTHGRPFVAGGAVEFSVSHSRARGLVALAPAGTRLGVDIEAVRARPRLDRLAARVCSAAELAAWHAEPPDRRLRAFLQLWTAKEAFLKATGQGITTTLARVSTRAAGWHVEAVDAGDGYVASFAIDATPVEVEVADWAVSSNAGTGG